jgi:hypothetical protein
VGHSREATGSAPRVHAAGHPADIGKLAGIGKLPHVAHGAHKLYHTHFESASMKNTPLHKGMYSKMERVAARSVPSSSPVSASSA